MILVLAVGTCCLPAHSDTLTRTSSFEYDASGLLSKEVIEPDSANDCLQTSYTYDGYGNKTGVSTAACAGASGYTIASAAVARTASTSYSADARFPVSSTNALAQSETKVFDTRFGTITSLTGPNTLTTTWAYDGFGRKTLESRADGTKTNWTYKLCTDSSANCPGPIAGAVVTWVLVEQSLALNNAASAPEKRQYHDTLNRVVRVQTQGYDGVSAAPSLIQDTEYNALGQVSRKSNLYASTGTPVWTSNTYDVLGRVLTQSQPDPAATASGGIATTTNTYNALVSSTTNAKGQLRTTTRNAQGQVAQITDAHNTTTSYSYDALGQLLSTNAAGSTTTITYNQRGHKIAMADPSMGAWAYAYNAFGELVYQRDSLNQSATMVYDVLARMTKRTEPDLISEWSFDKKFDASACGKGVGKLCEAKSDNGYNRKHSYDSLGRMNSTATVLDSVGSPATVSAAFDTNTGRVSSKTWPTGYQALYTYSALGYLKTVTGGGTNGFTQTVSHDVLTMNAQGQITQYRYGNQVTTVKTLEPNTQRLMGQTATLTGQSTGNVLNQAYNYDALGNLTVRNDNTTGVGTQESFSYDSLNRLTTASILGGAVSPPTSTEVMYDPRGNITYKSDVGRYWYDAARPNRMTNVTLETAPGATQTYTGTRTLSYAFDDYMPGAQTLNGTTLGNGNLMYTVSHDTVRNVHTVRSETYTSFNMPGVISYGTFITNTTSTADRTLSFIYGPEHQRIKQNVNLTGNGTSAYFAGNVWYLNGEDGQGLSYEKEIRTNGTTEHKHFVSAAGTVFALFTSRTGTLNCLPARSTSYLHHDQLESISAITNESGTVVERLAYDPWGKRRFITTTPGLPDNLDAIVGQKTDRGYTMPEHLDEIGVTHMNGRIYDPLVGRFMSADPFIQSPGNLQSHNRYAYVLNNPLAYTDPSGYFSFKKLFRAVVAIAVGYWTGGALANWIIPSSLGAPSLGLSIASGAAGGFAASAVSSGNLNGALQGALTGGLFGAAGTVPGADSPGRYFAHAAAGCISSAAGGGNCGSGAGSAVFGKFATNHIDGSNSIQGDLAKGIAVSVAGGVGSVIAGGKFENGATTAAFGYLFNFLAHERRVQHYNPNTGETEIAKRYVVSFSLSDENDPTLGMVEEYANKGLRGVAKGVFRFADFIAPDGYGTPDIDGLGAKWNAYKMDAPLKNLYSNMSLTTDLGGITTAQMRGFLDAAGSKVTNFTSTYGTTDQIMKRIEQKYDGSWRR